jgi:hypothetical protein
MPRSNSPIQKTSKPKTLPVKQNSLQQIQTQVNTLPVQKTQMIDSINNGLAFGFGSGIGHMMDDFIVGNTKNIDNTPNYNQEYHNCIEKNNDKYYCINFIKKMIDDNYN